VQQAPNQATEPVTPHPAPQGEGGR
jgi:hypothetical protein